MTWRCCPCPIPPPWGCWRTSPLDTDRYCTGWQSEEYDALLDQAAAETGEQAVRTLAQAEQLLLRSGVVLPLYTSMSYYAVSSEVQGAWIDPGEGVIYIKYITKS